MKQAGLTWSPPPRSCVALHKRFYFSGTVPSVARWGTVIFFSEMGGKASVLPGPTS